MKALTKLITASALLWGGSAEAQFYTLPFGPGGTWNLYEVTNNAVNTTPATATWKAAHQAAISKTAASTGVSGVVGNPTTGHLVAIGSWAENAMISLIAIRHTGSSNVWIGLSDSDDADLGGAGWADAQPNKISDQWYWAGYTAGGTGTGPNGWAKMSEGGNYEAFFNTEPNGNTEDAVELRTDGRWNDLAHNTAATVRRSVIEWEIGSATPIAGATVLNPFFTAPFGTGGTWNLYMVVGEADTWLNAHNRAVALPAQASGLPGVAGNATPGHLLQISGRAENSMGVALQNRLFTFNNQIGANTATTNGWIGLTDSDVAPFSTVEAGTSETINWVWAGTTTGSGPNGQERIEDTLENGAVVNFWFNANTGGTGEPNDSNGEDAGELRGDGRWNDLPYAAPATPRRYIIEWEVNAAAPIAGADPAPLYFTAQHGAGGTWNLYSLDYTQDTFKTMADLVVAPGLPASALGIPSLTSSSAKGHLIEIANLSESGWAYRLSNYTGGWIGLTDNEAYGGQEAGNASNNPTNQVHPFWIWASDTTTPVSTNSYRRWNAGEPNDAGGNEDAGEMTGTGFMNDNQMNTLTTIRKGLLEWDIQSPTPVTGPMVIPVEGLLAGTRTLSNPVVAGTWSIREIRDPVQSNITQCLVIANSPLHNGSIIEGTSPVINFNDRAAPINGTNYPGFGDIGLFGGDLPYLSDTSASDDNNMVRIGQTKLTVTEDADYTINVHTDDGFALRLAGQNFIQALGLGIVEGDTLFVPYGGADSNARGVVHLAPGTYDLEFISYEATGGSSWEVSIAKGVFASDEAGAGLWTLIGTPSAAYPAPVLPSFTYAPDYDDGQWGLHVASGAGTIVTLADAINALQNPAAVHQYGKAPVLNHSDADRPGVGGIFAGELDLPGAVTGADENDFAVHARGRLVIPAAGQHTFCFKGSEWAAIRIAGQAWQNVGGDFGVDPADASTVFIYRNNSANNNNLSDFVARAVITLPAGCHDIDFISGDRDGSFFMELYTRPGNFINTGEYTSSTANNGVANPTSNDYRLVGYKSTGTLPVPGVDGNGWTRRGTTPATTTQPAGWPGTNIANHEIWLTANGVTTDPTTRDTVNERDPQSPTTDAGIPNGRDIWRQTTNDDNYLDEGFDANLVIPAAGTYSLGWQGDDGGFIEIHNLPAGVEFSSRFEAMAVLTPSVANAANGTVNGRIQLAVGGGNTRTISRVTFPDDGSVTYPATYPIKSLHFEGTGGCYWEIFAGPANGYGRMLTLLSRNGADAAAADVSGIQLAGPDIEVVAVGWAAGPAFSFTFNSVSGVTYTIWRSDDLTNWANQGTITATAATTTYTSGPIGAGEPRYFYRASK
jgi:hypothetical protein